MNRALPNNKPSTKEVQMFHFTLAIACVIATLMVLILVASIAEKMEN